MKNIQFLDSSVSKPIGPYSTMAKVGGFLFLSGQIALDAEKGELKGDTISEQTVQILKNIEVIISEAGYSKENIFKCVIYLRNMKDFNEMNEVYKNFFGSHKPVRTTVEVSSLPRNALIEIEVSCFKEEEK
ncbi:MAG: RidA family protein [Brevinematia bacterium]